MHPPSYLAFDPASRHVRLDPHADAFVQEPYAAYAFFHAHARTFFWEEFGFWCLAGFDDVNRLFRDKRFGRERPGGYLAAVSATADRAHLADFDRAEAFSMLELEPPVHTRLRTLVNRAFVSRQVERLRPRIEKLANRLIDAFEADGTAELIRDFATPLPATVIAEMMGLDPAMSPQLVAWSNDMVRLYMHGPTRAEEEQANRSAGEFAALIRSEAAARRASPGDDLLSVLASASAEGDRLSEEELVSSAILLLNAGHEATVHQTGNAVKTILAQGGDPARFFSTPQATAATVEECLRYDPPLHMFTRIAYGGAEIAPGIVLQPGEQVGLLLGAANRDPLAFHEASRFNPERQDQRNVSFGAGIHFCIGAPLARLELQVALKTLFDRLPRLRLSENSEFRDSYHFHGLETLHVAW